MLVPADVAVMSRERFERFRGIPNTLAYQASREGQAHESVA